MNAQPLVRIHLPREAWLSYPVAARVHLIGQASQHRGDDGGMTLFCPRPAARRIQRMIPSIPRHSPPPPPAPVVTPLALTRAERSALYDPENWDVYASPTDSEWVAVCGRVEMRVMRTGPLWRVVSETGGWFGMLEGATDCHCQDATGSARRYGRLCKHAAALAAVREHVQTIERALAAGAGC